MAITKMEGRTYDMLIKDKRVSAIEPVSNDVVAVSLAPGWQNNGDVRRGFDDWCSARNWVRKAKEVTA